MAASSPKVLAGEDLAEAQRLLSQSPLFVSLGDAERETIAKGMEKRSYPAGIDLLSQGQESVEVTFPSTNGLPSMSETALS